MAVAQTALVAVRPHVLVHALQNVQLDVQAHAQQVAEIIVLELVKVLVLEHVKEVVQEAVAAVVNQIAKGHAAIVAVLDAGAPVKDVLAAVKALVMVNAPAVVQHPAQALAKMDAMIGVIQIAKEKSINNTVYEYTLEKRNG